MSSPPRPPARPPTSPAHSRAFDQAYFIGLAVINRLHGLLPFALRPMLYRACRFDIAPSATLQGGIRFFNVGRLAVGDGSLVNRGVYLDNRAGITIGKQVSIAHDARIYTMGHDVHDAGFATKGASVRIDDHAVIFAGAMIMPGVHLGEGAVVMAGSVVTKSVPAMRIVGGNPAQDIGERTGKPDYTLARRFWLAH
jgi:acetyltransferase-like isoleucine patch superfamily enzyme